MKFAFTIYANHEDLAKFETNDEGLFDSVVDSLGTDWSRDVRIRITRDGHPPATYKMEEIP